MSTIQSYYLRDLNGVALDVVIHKLQEEVDERTGKMDAVINLEGGSYISFTLEPKQQPKPRPWWQVWRRK